MNFKKIGKEVTSKFVGTGPSFYIKRIYRAAVSQRLRNTVLHDLSVCICSPRYPACNALAPYRHLWPASLYKMFPHYLINGTIFEKLLLNIKCVFSLSLQMLSQTFLVLRNTERDMIKNVYCSSCKVPLIVVRF